MKQGKLIAGDGGRRRRSPELLLYAPHTVLPEENCCGPREKNISTLVNSAGSSCCSSTGNQQLMCTDNLISNVAKSLPEEIDAAHQQRWDSVIVNRYLCDLREAKKLGRQERLHKLF
ncbi:hypothetical protein PIB30_056624 [Stylosanthes scabra]|uniref:Uncharacterized protein n=1 Tax=Stylosanthes scabra TaxID=79078 RepID=A0ABU6ZI61_9FABA|nr:hypothetical protein [Stylosanthes scabra]